MPQDFDEYRAMAERNRPIREREKVSEKEQETQRLRNAAQAKQDEIREKVESLRRDLPNKLSTAAKDGERRIYIHLPVYCFRRCNKTDGKRWLEHKHGLSCLSDEMPFIVAMLNEEGFRVTLEHRPHCNQNGCTSLTYALYAHF